MNTLTLSAIRCTLKHVNVRKEGNEEDGLELANDLKFALQTRGDVALRALRAEPIISSLYDENDNLVCGTIKALQFALEMDDHRLDFDVCPDVFDRVTLKSFVLELLGPGPEAELTFVAQVKPTPEQAADVQSCLREEVMLTIEPPDTLPGVAKTGRLDEVPDKMVKDLGGKSGEGDNTICPECKKPFTEKDTSCQISTKDTKTPRFHSKCMTRRMNRAAKAIKKKK